MHKSDGENQGGFFASSFAEASEDKPLRMTGDG